MELKKYYPKLIILFLIKFKHGFLLLIDSLHKNILSHIVVSQIDIFKEFGGVIPEVASRNHLDVIDNVFKKVFKDDKTYKKIINYSLSILVAAVLANLVNSLALVLLGYSSEPVTNVSLFFAYAIPRLVSIPIHVLIYVPVCYLICEKMKKIKMFNFE